jgi:HAD superfamily hydrolase (TIGR01450 family)
MNSASIKPEVLERLAAIRHVALDLDGTVYKGSSLFPFSAPFLVLLKEMGIGYTFLTNNPSKSIADYLAHLRKLGIHAVEDEIYTSTQATIECLKREWPEAERLFVLGTESMCTEFKKAGFVLLADDPKAEPDLVVVGFDTGLVYSRLCRAAWWIHNGKPYVATNPDRICPTDQPTVLVDCGSIVAALESATGVSPARTLGKPDPSMIQGILNRHSLQPPEVAMVGDRLYTDMEMARRAGALGVLVLTGETSATLAATAVPAPDLILEDLSLLGAALRRARLESAVP